MNNELNLLLAQNEDFKLVKVQFPGSTKCYTYKTTLDIKEDDQVVVDSPSNGFQILKAYEVIPAIESELTFNYNLKWIVSKVDLEYYEKCQDMERKANRELNKLRASRRRTELEKELTEAIGSEGVETVKALVRL